MGHENERRARAPLGQLLCALAALGLTQCVPEVSYDDATPRDQAGADGAVDDDDDDEDDDEWEPGDGGGAGNDTAAAGAGSGAPATDDDDDDDDDDADDEDEDDDDDRGGTGMGNVAAGGGAAAAVSACEELEEEALAALETHCSKCHGPGTNTVFDTILDPDALEASGKILPGDSGNSPLFRRMSGGSMPPASVAERPSQEEIDVVGAWIDECLEAPTAEVRDTGCGLPEVSDDDAIGAMVVDMLSSDIDDRPFIRYFTLNHVVNAGGCEEDLIAERFALAKAANALSLGTSLVVPEPIDAQETVLRVDIRDLEWDESGARPDKWELLVDANPYAFVRESDDAELLRTFAETDVPFQNASWFVHDATQPPLYHDLLEIPENFADLEDTLNIDVVQNILDTEIVRAGFLDSGVSGNNRVIERHELPSSGAQSLWLSYDFANDGGDENVFADPLAFDADGSEIIFTLPNGLHGYMVSAADGTRLDEAPTQIVVDDGQPDRNVRNGISCISCHVEGIKPKSDELRAHVLSSRDFDDDEVDDVLRVYVTAEEFNDIVDRDSKLFQDAVDVLKPEGAPIGEPVIKSFNRFEANVSLAEAAAELGITERELLRELGALAPELSPLATASIKRETFEAFFAETVCVLNLGLANDNACRNNNNNNDDDDVDVDNENQ